MMYKGWFWAHKGSAFEPEEIEKLFDQMVGDTAIYYPEHPEDELVSGDLSVAEDGNYTVELYYSHEIMKFGLDEIGWAFIENIGTADDPHLELRFGLKKDKMDFPVGLTDRVAMSRKRRESGG